MAWCLTKQAKDKLLEALKKDGDPQKMVDRGSEGRIKFLSEYVGDKNAREINASFESKLLLKRQRDGFISFVKGIGGKQYVKRDFLSKLKNLDKALSNKEVDQFLESIVSKRLGIDVPEEQYKGLQEAYKKTEETRLDWEKELKKHPEWSNPKTVNEWKTNETRLKYGYSKVALEKYVNDLKLEAKSINFRDGKVEYIKDIVGKIPGLTKSSLASMDNSFWGRQGIKNLYNYKTSDIWARNYLTSWKDIGKQIVAKGKIWKSGDDAVIDLIKADIYSRPNAINGKYTAGGYGLDVLNEEAYPTHAIERIPLLGRLFKASDVAYSGGALKMRADLADRLIYEAENNGINMLDREEARGLGSFVNSLTGRGNIGIVSAIQKPLNTIFFAPKFAKSSIDVLTGYSIDKKIQSGKFSKAKAKESSRNILSVIASILLVTKLFKPDNVDLDPRSTTFGKIKIFGIWTDITGGMSSYVTLVSRLTPTIHNGKWGLWSKSSSGNWTQLNVAKYGARNAFNVFIDFFANKASPVSGMLLDYWRGRTFSGDRLTLKNSLENITVPITFNNYKDLKDDPNATWVIGSMLLDMNGLSASSYYYKANWDTSTSKEMTQFREKVGNDRFKKANEEYNNAYNFVIKNLENDPDYKRLSEEGKKAVKKKIKSNTKKKIFKEYNFRYKKLEKTDDEKENDRLIKKILRNL